MEPEAAALAAAHGTTQDFDRLRDVLLEPVNGAVAHHSADSRFHVGIAAASGNPLLQRVVAELCVAFSTWGPIPEAHRDFAGSHRSMYDSLMTRDADGARERMSTHLAAVRDSYVELVD